MKHAGLPLIAAVLMFVAGLGRAAEVIRLANHPALSPDGAVLAFDWDGDIWTRAHGRRRRAAIDASPGPRS